MLRPAGFQPPLDEAQPTPRPDKQAAAEQDSRDPRRGDLAYGCVDWFEYPRASESLPMREIKRFAAQRVEKDADQQPRTTARA